MPWVIKWGLILDRLMEYMQMTLAFGSTKCSQCLCSTGLRRFKIFLLKKEKNCQFQTSGNNCSWSKNRTPLKCGVFWLVALTPCIPLPAKGYKETASIKEWLANLFNLFRRWDTPWACAFVFCLQKGFLCRSYSKWSQQHSSFTKTQGNFFQKSNTQLQMQLSPWMISHQY